VVSPARGPGSIPVPELFFVFLLVPYVFASTKQNGATKKKMYAKNGRTTFKKWQTTNDLKKQEQEKTRTRFFNSLI